MKIPACTENFPPPAFTLIELMVVVAIVGLIAAMSVPSILQTFRKEGMRQTLEEVQGLLRDARARAIYSNRTTEIVFHPAEKRLELTEAPMDVSPVPLAGAPAAGAGPASPPPPIESKSVLLPGNVDIAMLDINLLDCGAAEAAWVRFYPNGTCEELTLVLHCGDEWEKISLEFSTALATVSPVTR